MNQVSATRTEMLMRQDQIRLAAQGAELLRSKREALIREFLEELKQYTQARQAMRQTVTEAIQSLMQTLAVDGPEAVASAIAVCQRPITLETKAQNIWGTKVVDIKSDYAVRRPSERHYGTTLTSARIEETTEQFEQVVDKILQIAPIDLKLRAIAEDLRKTSRRVNALEQRLLPQLKTQVRYIRNALDQREREDIFRLKRLKRKKC